MTAQLQPEQLPGATLVRHVSVPRDTADGVTVTYGPRGSVVLLGLETAHAPRGKQSHDLLRLARDAAVDAASDGVDPVSCLRAASRTLAGKLVGAAAEDRPLASLVAVALFDDRVSVARLGGGQAWVLRRRDTEYRPLFPKPPLAPEVRQALGQLAKSGDTARWEALRRSVLADPRPWECPPLGQAHPPAVHANRASDVVGVAVSMPGAQLNTKRLRDPSAWLCQVAAHKPDPSDLLATGSVVYAEYRTTVTAPHPAPAGRRRGQAESSDRRGRR